MKTTIYEPHRDYPKYVSVYIAEVKYTQEKCPPKNPNYWYEYADGKFRKLEYWPVSMKRCYLYKVYEYESEEELWGAVSSYFTNYHSWIPKEYTIGPFQEAFESFIATLKQKGILSQMEMFSFAYNTSRALEKSYIALKPKSAKTSPEIWEKLNHFFTKKH